MTAEPTDPVPRSSRPKADSAPKQRIAYLTGEYPKASHTFILREAEALRSHGLEVITCSIRRVGQDQLIGPEETEAERTTFYVLEAARNPMRQLKAHGGWLTRAPGRWFKALKLAWRMRPEGAKAALYQLFYFLEAGVLADELRAREVQHLHNHFANSSCSVAMLTSVISGIPYSFTMHGPAIFFEAKKWALDEKVARASFVACISHFCRSQGMLFSNPAEWHKLRIVHCGVDPERYGRQNRAPGKRLIFVGRLAAVKGVPVVLEALAIVRETHPDTMLTLVGDGSERPQIEARIAELGLSDTVRLTGYLSQSGVAEELAASDIFVLPSFAEGVPVVLMEAMATGLPVVATRIAGIPELVEHGNNGHVVPPGDVETLAAALNALLDDPATGTAMGMRGKAKVVSEFNLSNEAAWLRELLNPNLQASHSGRLRPAGNM